MPYITPLDSVAAARMDVGDTLSTISPMPDMSQPPVALTPAHAILPHDSAAEESKDITAQNMTPPPSSQVPRSVHGKSRTPTPTFSHISTPPPTVEAPLTHNEQRSALAGLVSDEEIARAPAEELRAKLVQVQAALSESKTSAAHYKLQYHMLSQESAATMQRMVVEARMAQFENEVIHSAEQARVAATPVQTSPVLPPGIIPVSKELYQQMCHSLSHLREGMHMLETERAQQDQVIAEQESQIASLGDKIILMRERIRESREHINRYRLLNNALEGTPRSSYGAPSRRVRHEANQQPFAALLQASEMASEAVLRHGSSHGRRGHARNSLSTSSVPQTPTRAGKHQPVFYTPAPTRTELKIPATAPLPRTSALRTPEKYHSRGQSHLAGPPSDGTVSADEVDSEAETEIIEEDEVDEPQASLHASHILRTSQEQQSSKRANLQGRGMLEQRPQATKQTTLFGAIRKRNIDRGDNEPAAKRARGGEVVGLGIQGVRN